MEQYPVRTRFAPSKARILKFQYVNTYSISVFFFNQNSFFSSMLQVSGYRLSACLPASKPPLSPHNPSHSPPCKKRRGNLKKQSSVLLPTSTSIFFGLPTSNLSMLLRSPLDHPIPTVKLWIASNLLNNHASNSFLLQSRLGTRGTQLRSSDFNLPTFLLLKRNKRFW